MVNQENVFLVMSTKTTEKYQSYSATKTISGVIKIIKEISSPHHPMTILDFQENQEYVFNITNLEKILVKDDVDLLVTVKIDQVEVNTFKIMSLYLV